MKPTTSRNSLPTCCTPAAYRLMAKHAGSIEESNSLLAGAVAIAMHQMADASLPELDQQLQDIADQLHARVHGKQPQAMLAHLHDVLFDELGFMGEQDPNEYYNPINSYVPAAFQLRRGLPITLALIYKNVADRIGLPVRGVGLPGHFVVGVGTDEKDLMLVDCFNGGRVLDRDDARALIESMFGEEMAFSDDLLRPVSNRHWLTRMLQNLLHVFTETKQFEHVAAMLELEMLLWPRQIQLQRDLGLVLARIGMSAPASNWLKRYLDTNPNDPAKDDLQQLLGALSA
jgi:regulator of sirC expression with transglutaminase-like and TPR domain